MKISARQVKAAVDAYLLDRGDEVRRSGSKGRTASAATDSALLREFDLLPEERDIVVHDLRAKVRKGHYFISGIKIVEALLGRLAAGLTAD